MVCARGGERPPGGARCGRAGLHPDVLLGPAADHVVTIQREGAAVVEDDDSAARGARLRLIRRARATDRRERVGFRRQLDVAQDCAVAPFFWRIPRVRWCTLENASHFAHLEQPERFL